MCDPLLDNTCDPLLDNTCHLLLNNCSQVYSSGTDVKQRGLHVVVLNQGNVSTIQMQCELLSVLGCQGQHT